MNSELPPTLARCWGTLTAVAAASVLVLAPAGYAAMADTDDQRSIWDHIYRTMQLFTLSCDVSGNMPAALQAARYLAAFVVFSAVAAALAALFHDRIIRLRLRFFSGHVVVCGLGSGGGALVQGLRDAGEQVVVIEPNANHEDVLQCRELGAIVLAGQGLDAVLLRRARVQRARFLLALDDRDCLNVEAALLGRHANAGRIGAPLRCIVQVERRELTHVLRQSETRRTEDDPFSLEVIDLHEVAAQVMLAAAALSQARRILIVGLGRLGQAVLLQAVDFWCGKQRETKLHAIAIDRRAEELRRDLPIIHPALGAICTIDWHNLDVTHSAFAEGAFLRTHPPDVAFVCLGDESIAVLAGARLGALITAGPVVVRMAEDGGLSQLLRCQAGNRLRAVAMRELLSRPELLLTARAELRGASADPLLGSPSPPPSRPVDRPRRRRRRNRREVSLPHVRTDAEFRS